MQKKYQVITRFLSFLLSSCLLMGLMPSFAIASDSSANSSEAQSSNVAPASDDATDTAPSVVRKVASKTSEYCDTYLLSDGSYRAVINQNPVNYQDEKGSWKRIDTTLEQKDQTQSLSPSAIGEDLTFSKQQTGQSPVTLKGDDYSLTLNMLGACEGVPQARGSVSTYEDVAQDTDLSYDVKPNGIKETLFLQSADAPLEYSFNMRLDGLESRETSHGLALFKTGEGKPFYNFGDLVVFDSSKNQADEPSYDTQAKMTYEKTETGLKFTYHLSKDWLTDPARVFPVQVDPSITKNASDTFISSAFPNTNYSGSDELKVGRYDSTTGYNRALIRYVLSDIPSDAYVSSATLRLYQVHTYYVDTATTTYLGLVKKNWTSSNTWSSLGCSKGDTSLFSSYRSKSFSGRGVHVTFEVASAVRDWIDGSAVNNGFCLYQTEGATGQEPECWRKFSSANISNDDNKPQLIINYTVPELGAVTFDRTPATSANTSLSYPTFSYNDDISFYCSLKGNYPGDITSIRALINETEAPAKPRCGQVAWFPTTPDSSIWEYYALPAERGGGYVAKSKGEGTGTACITLVPDKCSAGLSGSGDSQVRRVNFVIRPTSAFTGSLVNHIDSYASMANGWSKGYVNNGGAFGLVPARNQNKITSVTTTASAQFFKINAQYSQKDPENFNTERDAGRGSVNISWAKNPQATGYKVTFYDGYLYREVADIPSADITSWSSKDSGMFPADSAYKSQAQDSMRSSTLYDRIKSPYGTPNVISLETTGGLNNAGLTATDGEHYFVHTYKSGENKKSPVVMYGLDGKNPKVLTYSFANNANSLLSINNTLYSSVLSSPNMLDGVRLVSEKGEDPVEKVSHLEMEQPFMFAGGAQATSGANILVSANDNYIVNAAVISGGTLKVRIFKDDGTFVGDKTLTGLTFGALDSVVLDASNALTVISQGLSCQVTKVAIDAEKTSSPLRLITRYAFNRTSAASRAFTYNQENNQFIAGSTTDSANDLKLYSYSGPGYDLSDNVNALYNAVGTPSNSTYYNDHTNYAFTVVPYNSVGRDYYDYDVNATNVATLEGRSYVASERSLAQNADEREVLGMNAGTVMPSGGLKLSKEIASLASFGPDVSLSLMYDSTVPSTTLSMLGVSGLDISAHTRLELSSSGAYLYYYDADLVRHVFSAVDANHTRYASSIGTDALIERVGSNYVLRNESRDVFTFDQDGKPLSVADRNQNTMSYEWDGSKLQSINAPNGQRIIFEYTPSGQLSTISGPGISSTFSRTVNSLTVTNELSHESLCFSLNESQKLSRITDELGNVYVPQIETTGKLDAEHFQSSESTSALRAATFSWSDKTQSGECTLTVERAGKKARIGTDVRGLIQRSSQFVNTDSAKDDSALFSSVSHTFNGFDRYGNLISQTVSASNDAAKGTTEKWTYDARGNELRHVTSLGRITKSTYSQDNDLVKQADPSGQVTFNAYDGRGNLLQERKLINDSGKFGITEYTYAQEGNVRGVCTSKRTKIDDNSWATTRYSDFDTITGEPKTTTEQAIALSSGGSPTDVVSSQEFDELGHVIIKTDAGGATERFTYDDAGRQVASTDARGKKSVSVYDNAGQVVESYDEGDGLRRNWKKSRYNLFGDVEKEDTLNASGEVISSVEHTYDALGNEITSDDSSVAGTAKSSYDAQGNVVSQTEEGLVAGAQGVTQEQAEAAASVNTTYDEHSNPLTVKDVGVTGSAQEVLKYSDDGDLLSDTSADGSVTETEFDENTGQATEISNFEGASKSIEATTGYTYDFSGNVLDQTETDKACANYTYDLLGRTLTAKMLGSKETTYTYNALGWPLKVEETYAASSKAGVPNDALHLLTTYTYDKAGRVLKKEANNQITTYSYNNAGDLISQNNADNSHKESTYNAFGEQTHMLDTATDGSRAHDVTYSYDEQGRQLSAQDAADFAVSSETTYTMMQPSNEASQTSGEVAQTTYSMPHFTLHNTTNTSGQFESAVLSNETSQVADMRVSERDGAGRVLKLDSAFSLPNLSRKYDDIGRLSMQSFEASAPQTYKYLDNSSKLSEQNLLTGNLTYQYDLGTGRFISSNQASYSYETTTALPMSGRVQQPQSYAFNELGQRTRSLVGTSSATLGWFGERLTSFETSDTSAHYIYDSSGMRLKSSITHLGATSDTSYAYDGLRLMELSQSGANPYRIGYLYEDQNTTPYAASYETSETALSFTLESNVRGDVIALRDTLGNVFATYSYGDYGEPQAVATHETELVSANLAKDVAERQVFRYAGYLYDDYSGMYYCAARYYDPATQVFISLDPVRADGARSGYLYCNGDPINQTDVSGLWWSLRYHEFSSLDAVKYTAEKLTQMAISNVAEEIATTLIFGPLGGPLTVRVIKGLLEISSTSSTIRDTVSLVKNHARKGDKLFFQRSDYLYHNPSCHKNAQWELRMRMLLKRKNGTLQDFKTLPPIPWSVRGIYSTRPLRIPHRRAAHAF